MNSRMRLRVIVLVVLIVGTIATEILLNGGAKKVSLEPGAALTGSISQALDTSGGDIQLPIAGMDYNLDDTKYFDNSNWAVAIVAPIKNNFDRSAVVLQKQSGIFKVVAGPSNALPGSYLKSLPADVGKYLEQLGVVDGSIGA